METERGDKERKKEQLMPAQKEGVVKRKMAHFMRSAS